MKRGGGSLLQRLSTPASGGGLAAFQAQSIGRFASRSGLRFDRAMPALARRDRYAKRPVPTDDTFASKATEEGPNFYEAVATVYCGLADCYVSVPQGFGRLVTFGRTRMVGGGLSGVAFSAKAQIGAHS